MDKNSFEANINYYCFLRVLIKNNVNTVNDFQQGISLSDMIGITKKINNFATSTIVLIAQERKSKFKKIPVSIRTIFDR